MRRRFSSGKAVLAALLSVCVLSTTLPTTALADQTTKNQTTTDQTTDDGFVCQNGHKYKKEFFEEVKECQHKHTDECYPEGGGIATSGNADIASFGNARYPRSTPFNGKEPTECTHECNEEEGCIIKKSVCPVCSIEDRIRALPDSLDKMSEDEKKQIRKKVQEIQDDIQALDKEVAEQIDAELLKKLEKLSGNFLIFTEADYVQGLTPSNVTVNLFDYWLVERNTEDYSYNNVKDPSQLPASYYVSNDCGINTGHSLIFVGPDKFGEANHWTRQNGGARENLVKRNLDGTGYPYTQLDDPVLLKTKESFQKLIDDGDVNIKKVPPLEESLAYLFDPNMGHSGKQSFTNVGGLFQIDEDGNYYYDSERNFAEFIEKGGGGNFRLYNEPGVTGEGHSSINGQFFPFDTGEEIFLERKADGQLDGMKRRCETGINHYFGLTMEADFMQPVDGKISNSNATEENDMAFEFTGDDDVWVFIDDVLVADMGGIHDTMKVNINFATGDVKFSQYNAEKKEFLDRQDNTNLHDTTLKTQYELAYREKYQAENAGLTEEKLAQMVNDKLAEIFDGDIFRDDTTHTMKVFYLERGNNSSNLALEFNLLEPHYHQIEKVDEDGNPLRDVEFALYEANENWDAGAILVDGLVSGPDGMVNIVDRSGGKAEGNNVTFKDGGHYILREVNTLPGYVNTGDIRLSYSAETNILTVENQWTVGAVGGFEADVIQAGPLRVASDANATNPEENLVEKAKNGLIIPIPFFKKEGRWYPMYGSVVNGFQLIERSEEESPEGAAMAALLYQISDLSNENWYLDWNKDHARFEGHLKGLPGFPSRYIYVVGEETGDIKTEYYLLEHGDYTEEMSEEAKYEAIRDTLTKYVIENRADLDAAIKEMVENLLGQNGEGSNGKAPKLTRLNVSDFNRRFYSHLYIPNQARELRVMKQDEYGNSLGGAEFTLYEDAGCNTAVAKGVTDEKGMLTFSVRNTGNNGVNGGSLSSQVKFPLSMKRVENQEPQPRSYWLKETKAPDGYNANEQVVEVRITEDGLYANAGNDTVTGDDMVSVRIGVGELVQTMVRYAASEELNTTLRDIEAIPYVLSGNHSGQALSSSNASDWRADTDEALQLHYGLEGALRDYGEHVKEGENPKPYFVTTEGWAGFQIRQYQKQLDDGTVEKCPNPEHNKATGEWVDLATEENGGNDITNLFTGTTTVVMKNKPIPGAITVKKIVSGSEGDPYKDFQFRVEVGEPLNGTYGDMHFTNGVAAFTLRHEQICTAAKLPLNMTYKVTELDADTDGYVTTSEGEVGVTDGETCLAVFTNKKGGDTPPPDPDPEGKTGNLQVRKFVSGADETELQNDVFGFRITLSKNDTNGQAVIAEEVDGLYGESESQGIRFEKGEATIALKHGESRLATGLPAGLTYHIVETEKGEYEIENFENASGTIEEGKTAVATCYNKKSGDPSDPGGEKGSLTVRKTVTGSAGEKDRAFNFKVELDPAVSGVYGQMTFENGVAEFALKDGESRIATDLPLGTGYTVTEKEANADGYITTAVDADGTIRKEGNIVSFTNNKDGDTPPPDPEKKYGALTVSKTVSGSRGDRYKPFAFTVTLHDASINGAYGDMEFENGIARFTLKHGETKTATNLPDGTEYVVEESDNTGYKVTWTGKTGKIEADKTAAVLCQNYRGGGGGGGDDDDDDPPEDPYVPYIPPVPGDPGRPGIPPVPGDPGVPFVPERPMVPGLPRTGDDTSYGLWFGLLAVSGLGLLTLYFKGRKKKDEEEE